MSKRTLLLSTKKSKSTSKVYLSIILSIYLVTVSSTVASQLYEITTRYRHRVDTQSLHSTSCRPLAPDVSSTNR